MSLNYYCRFNKELKPSNILIVVVHHCQTRSEDFGVELGY